MEDLIKLVCVSIMVVSVSATAIVLSTRTPIKASRPEDAIKKDGFEQYQQEQIKAWKDRAVYWNGQYFSMKHCVEQAATNQTPARACLGDKTS